MKKPVNRFDDDLTREFQLDFYRRLERASAEMIRRRPQLQESLVSGHLAAGMTASLICNLAQRGNLSPRDVVERLLEEIESASALGQIEEHKLETEDEEGKRPA